MPGRALILQATSYFGDLLQWKGFTFMTEVHHTYRQTFLFIQSSFLTQVITQIEMVLVFEKTLTKIDLYFFILLTAMLFLLLCKINLFPIGLQEDRKLNLGNTGEFQNTMLQIKGPPLYLRSSPDFCLTLQAIGNLFSSGASENSTAFIYSNLIPRCHFLFDFAATGK